MKAHEYISRLDDLRHARRMTEDTNDVAPAPLHAPTSGKDHTTTGQGKSDDEGEPVRKAYKQPSGNIPAPVAPAPSHAPTSGKDYTTTGQGKSEDEGEKISKEAMKEAVRQLIDGDANVQDLLSEGGHKPGCQCGFCKNKGSFGKKKKEGDSDQDGVGKPKEGSQPDKAMQEAGISGRLGAPVRPLGRRGLSDRFNFRQPVRPPAKGCVPPKAAINPYQPAMERMDSAPSVNRAIREMADRLIDDPYES
jgi:hypothetical protein